MKKSIPNYLGSTLLAASSLLLIAQSSEAISLIGNLSSTNDGRNGTISPTLPQQRAVGFTLPTGTDYTLNSISLRLQNYNTTAGDIALLQIYRDITGGSSVDPTTAALESVAFLNPLSSSDAAATFQFDPTITTFTFLANTKYWLLVDATAGDNFQWRGDNSTIPTVDNVNGGITPTGVATLAGYTSSFDNGGTYTFSAGLAQNGNGPFNSFDIDVTAATPVPFDFDPSLGLLGIGSLWLGRKYLKKIANKAKDDK